MLTHAERVRLLRHAAGESPQFCAVCYTRAITARLKMIQREAVATIAQRFASGGLREAGEGMLLKPNLMLRSVLTRIAHPGETHV